MKRLPNILRDLDLTPEEVMAVPPAYPGDRRPDILRRYLSTDLSLGAVGEEFDIGPERVRQILVDRAKWIILQRRIEERKRFRVAEEIDTWEIKLRTDHILRREGLTTRQALLDFVAKNGREGFADLRGCGAVTIWDIWRLLDAP